jgi:hypothetical protein
LRIIANEGDKMTSIADFIKSTFLADETYEKMPLHVGEVMSLWFYAAALKEINVIAQVGMNSTTDEELKEALQRTYDDCETHAVEIFEFLQKEGVPLPPVSEQKPKTDPFSVPEGAKLTDFEMANLISIKTASAIATCATGISQSIRVDVGAMWTKYLMKKIEFGAYFKPIMIKRGWIMYPPLYNPPGLPSK